MWKKIINTAFSRLARNIYFWLIIILTRFSNYEFSYSLAELSYFSILFVLLLGLLYLNNLVFIPFLLARKRYVKYFISISITLAASVYASVLIIEQQALYHPDINIFKTAWVPVLQRAIKEPPVLAFVHTFLFIVYLLIFTLLWYANDYRRKQNEVTVIKKRQLEIELDFLKNQLNPHFLFNTLNNLYALALKKTDTTPNAILQLSSILRYLLYESNTTKVSFRREKEIMNAYIELELLRLSDIDNVTFTINADRDYMVPPLLWLPVLENIFKHGRNNSAADIEYRCFILNEEFQIYSRNGYDASMGNVNNIGGIGMENLRKRLQLLYPGKYTLDITADANEYIVDLKLSLK
ncbi:MAG: histidine kinase [Bacteroidetes bacterium]|nr:histidine kinase [Bacteroidota bacterium]